MFVCPLLRPESRHHRHALEILEGDKMQHNDGALSHAIYGQMAKAFTCQSATKISPLLNDMLCFLGMGLPFLLSTRGLFTIHSLPHSDQRIRGKVLYCSLG